MEDFEAVMRGVLKDRHLNWRDLPSVPQDYNTRRNLPTHAGSLTWKDLEEADALLAEETRELSVRYGYEG